MMTKKHFVAVAQRIKEAREKSQGSTHASAVIDCLASDLADEFENFNDNFNRVTFLKACNCRVTLR